MATKYIDLNYNTAMGSISTLTTAATNAVTACTVDTPAVLTGTIAGATLYKVGDIVTVVGVVGGMVEIQGIELTIASMDGAALTMEEASAGYTAWTDGGEIILVTELDNAVRVTYDDSLDKGAIINAIQRAKEKLIENLLSPL